MDYRLEQLRFELREDPSSRAFFKLGEHLRREGELDEAIEILSSGLEHHGRYVAAWVSLGRAQLDNGDAKGAQEALENALRLDPENTVAARTMGEAAIVNGDWIGAVKALKRARGLVPRDDQLDQRIAFVEKRLEELGQLQQPPARAQSSEEIDRAEASWKTAKPEVTDLAPENGEEPFLFKGGDTGRWDGTDDVFAAGWVEEEPAAEPEAAATEALPEPEAEAPDPNAEPPPLTEGDLFPMVEPEEGSEDDEPADAVDEDEDWTPEEAGAIEAGFVAPATGIETEPEPGPEAGLDGEPGLEPEAVPDACAEPDQEHDLEPEPELEPDFESHTETEMEPGSEPGSEAEAEFDFVPDSSTEPNSELEPEPDLEPWDEPEPEEEAEPELEEGSESLPLPTMTLARLAIDQGDLDLAEKTLRGVLEREPGHAAASELLDTLVAERSEQPTHPPSEQPVDARAEALRRWLDAVRLASERLKT